PALPRRARGPEGAHPAPHTRGQDPDGARLPLLRGPTARATRAAPGGLPTRPEVPPERGGRRAPGDDGDALGAHAPARARLRAAARKRNGAPRRGAPAAAPGGDGGRDHL